MHNNILFVAPIGKSDTGYTNASNNSLNVWQSIQKKRRQKIEVIDFVKWAEYKPDVLKANELSREYDLGVIHLPLTEYVFKQERRQFIQFAMRTCKQRYAMLVFETEPLPPFFDTILKDNYFHGFLAPSHWMCNMLVDKLADLKIKKPVYYYPHHVNAEMFKPNSKPKSKFVALMIGQYTERKSISEITAAYCKSIARHANTEMIYKINYVSQPGLNARDYIRMHALENNEGIQGKLKIITENLSIEQLNNLYDYSNVLLFISKGEAFGIPAAEMMLKGKPVIYTKATSMPEVCGSNKNFAIDGYLDTARNMSSFGYVGNTKYYYPSVAQTIEALTHLYERWKNNQALYDTDFAENRNYIIERYGMNACSEHYTKILEV